MLTLSPMMVAPVCHVTDPLLLTCTASVEFIGWSILQANEQIAAAHINARDTNQMTERVVKSVTYTFMRTSARNATPLISTLFIDSVSIGLNGTVVRCSDLADPMTSASTTIQIIDASQISE